MIKARVEVGWVWLEGEVDWQFQIAAAEQAVRNLAGVRGVTNLLQLKQRASAADVKECIENALQRNAELDAKQIVVSASGGSRHAPRARSLVGGARRCRTRGVVGAGRHRRGGRAARWHLSSSLFTVGQAAGTKVPVVLLYAMAGRGGRGRARIARTVNDDSG